MTPGRAGGAAPPAGIVAMAAVTVREGRGIALPLLFLAGAVLFFAAGRALPSPMGAEGGLAGTFLYGALTLTAGALAAALGAARCAEDRRRGFRDLLFSTPLSGPAYFMGRFLGLAARITFLYGGALLAAGGLLLLAPGAGYFHASPAVRVETSGRPLSSTAPFLLLPKGRAATWTFAAPATGLATGRLRLTLRPRYPRGQAFSPTLPLAVRVEEGGRVRLERTILIKNRKGVTLPLRLEGGAPVRVRLEVREGKNLLEMTPEGCVLLAGRSSPVRALLAAGAAGLPWIYLALAAALFFSTFMHASTALFSTVVLALLVSAVPMLRWELAFSATRPWTEGTVPARVQGALQRPPPRRPAATGWRRSLARAARGLLGLLPDARLGGGLAPLSRMERPGRADILLPWRAVSPHLALLLLFGCLAAGRRRA